MEFHNLGNYVIAEPFFAHLRETFPDAEIDTSLQMSEEFYTRHRLRGLNHNRFWMYGYRTAFETAMDSVRVLLYKTFRSTWFLKGKLLNEIKNSDLVIDFSGDIYGDNAGWNKFLETNARLMFCLSLGKPVAMLIGSPGPFQSFWRQWLAKKVLPRLSLVTNREPLSTAMLAYIGIKGSNIISTACPSVLFKKKPFMHDRSPEDYDKIFGYSRPIVGFILCGWNMPSGPYNKWPREDSEFRTFIKLIEYLLRTTNYRICIMTHQNATNAEGGLEKGNDHRIIDKLFELLGEKVDGDRVFTLKGLYDAGETKFIISHFDILISGRIHGAVQGLSQGVPTVVIDYGHEPKAHKIAGFARVYGVDDFVADPLDSDSLINVTMDLISEKDRTREYLQARVPKIKEMALLNFRLIQKFEVVDK
ncbi:polysaccharide pyruvyl transferase family protein [Halomonas lysinitropha]|nr:polysaccharide pyruvyl transferase family protein [Halomonas lysinitropha]